MDDFLHAATNSNNNNENEKIKFHVLFITISD